MIRAADNPFRSERIEALPFRFPEGVTHASLFQQLDGQSGRGALTGPKGSGKTTLMLELERVAKSAGWKTCYMRLTETDRRMAMRRLSQPDSQTLVLLDGAEQLNWINWMRFVWHMRSAGRLVISTHSPGRLPVLLKTQVNADLLQVLLEQLTSERRDVAQCAALMAQHNGNLRAVFHRLYQSAALGEVS